MHVWYLIFCIRKWNSTHEGSFQSDFIYQYKEIFKSNPLQKIKKWNQFGLNTVHLCMYNSWPIPVHFMKKNTRRKWKTEQKGTEINHFINTVGKCCKDVGVFQEGTPCFMRANKEKGVAHKKRILNGARRETTQTTLVDNSDFLQSGNAVLSFLYK